MFNLPFNNLKGLNFNQGSFLGGKLPTAPTAPTAPAPIAQQPVAQQPVAPVPVAPAPVAPVAQQPAPAAPAPQQPAPQSALAPLVAAPKGVMFTPEQQRQMYDSGYSTAGKVKNEETGFVPSAAINPNMSDDEFIKAVYINELGRTPEKEGMDWWKQVLQSGTSREAVMEGINKSYEGTGYDAWQAKGLETGLKGAIGEYEKALGQSNQGLDQMTGTLSPWAKGGQSAFERQAALSGALGSEAQAKALAEWNESPEQAFLREQGERSVTRNAAALGGLGGGNVMKELNRFGTGLAAQDYQNSFDRLGSVSGMGGQAASQLATGQLGTGQFNAGLNAQLGNIRYGAGQDLAAQLGQMGGALGDLQNQQGLQDAAFYGGGMGNIANLLSGLGTQYGSAGGNLAALLANIASSAGSQFGGLPGIPGVQEQSGLLGNIGKAASGTAALIQASDVRLKDNIQQVGVSEGGHNLYTWDWNDKGKEIAGDNPTFGVLAQEVKEKNPDAVVVGSHGYLMVDYARIN